MTEQGSIDVPQSRNEKETLAFSPDGNLLAFTSGEIIVVRNTSTGSQEDLFTLDIPDWIISDIEFSPDGRQILVTTRGGALRCDGEGINFALYDLQGNLLFDRYACTAYSKNYYHFQDGRLYLVFSSIMTNVFPLESYVVDVDTGILLASSIKKLQGYAGDYSEIVAGSKALLPSSEAIKAWSPDPSPAGPGKVVENLLDEKCKLHKNVIDGYQALYTDGKKGLYLAIHFSEPVRLVVWDLQQCRVEKEITYPSADQLFFSPTGDLLATGNGVDVTVWNLLSGTVRFTVRGVFAENPVDLMAFNADGHRLITGTLGRESLDSGYYQDYSVSVWDTDRGTRRLELKPNSQYLKAIVPTTNKDVVMLHDSAGFSFWNIESGRLMSTIPSDVYTFEPSGSGIWVAVRSKEGLETITLFDFNTGEAKQTLTTTNASVRDLSISEDGGQLRVYYFKGQIQGEAVAVFDLKTKEKLWTMDVKDTDHYGDLKLDQIYPSYEQGYKQWTFDAARPFIAFPGFKVDQNHSLVITVEGGEYLFWDAKNENYLGKLYMGVTMDRISFSLDNYFIATVAKNGLIYIWGVKKASP